MTERRCTGHCCKRFFIGYTPEQFTKVLVWPEEDDATMHEMLVPLEIVHVADKAVGAWYTCKFFKQHEDGTGDCTIYERRPKMCRDYPGYSQGNSCSFKGCTLEPRGRFHRLPILQDERSTS